MNINQSIDNSMPWYGSQLDFHLILIKPQVGAEPLILASFPRKGAKATQMTSIVLPPPHPKMDMLYMELIMNF